IGCGDGLVLRALQDSLRPSTPIQLYGLDISMQGLLLARDVVPPSRLVQGSVSRMPFAGRFDLALCRGVIMFLGEQEIASAFRELAEHCNMLVMTEPSVRNGQQIEAGQLRSSVKREVVDQTSWIHPYPRLAATSGGTVEREEYVTGNYLMTVRWSRAA